ncbi:sugar-binding domain-containing protein [Actinopolymorpha sp. B9G3]|uniref:sugar-binding transcriptional regulator n=1 Tax=Actinopolymorpha sp. B9G3 TaxID=3158970 RepID=UPI0032D99D21
MERQQTESTAADELSETEQVALDSGDDIAVRIAVARRYYHQDQSKVTIAKALGLSRFQVARILQDARRSGLVRIEIGAPGRRDREMSAALQERLGLGKAVVVSAEPFSPHSAVEHVGRALAEEVVAAVKEGETLGMTWSSAAVVMAQHVGQLRRCSVVQLAGAIYPPAGMPGSVEICRTIAHAAGGDSHPIYAPLVVADAETAGGLRRQPEIADALIRPRSLDVAVLSVGAWHASASAVYDMLTPDQQQEVSAAGGCGEISGRVFDAEGHFISTPLDDRVIGIGAEDLKAVPRLLTSSHGAYRADATLAAVRAGVVHTLVVDSELASALLS